MTKKIIQDLENIMLSEISQMKANSIWSHLYVDSNKQNIQKITTAKKKKYS